MSEFWGPLHRYVFHAEAVAANFHFTDDDKSDFGAEYSLVFHGSSTHEQQVRTGGRKGPEISFADSFVSIFATESGGVYTTLAKSSVTGFSARGIVTADRIESGIMTVYRKEWYGNPKFPRRARTLPLTPVFENLKVCGIPFGPRLKLPAPFLFTDSQRDDYFRGNGDEIAPQGISRKFGKQEPSDCGKIRVSLDGRRIQIPKFGIVHLADWIWRAPDDIISAKTVQWVQLIKLDLKNPGLGGGAGCGGGGSVLGAHQVEPPFTPLGERTPTSDLLDRIVEIGRTADRESKPHLYEVWFGTNRAPSDPRNPSKGFSNKRGRPGQVYYGRCLVKVPRTHEFGSVGTAWWKRWATLRWDDDHLKIDRIITAIDDVSFFAALRAELESFGPADRQVLLYLHGYNVSFENAAIRAAQIGFDLKVKGLTAFFSWPSCASISKYFADAERIGASEQDITAFLVRLAENAAPKDVHIIAHSMGNRGLARAIQRIVGEASKHSGLRFGHIILAAPDIEVTLFRDLARVYPLLCQRTTMYVSARDKALGMSKWLQDAERAGYTPPVTVVPDIDTVEVTEVDLTLLGHGYYAEADGVLRDIYELINFNATPDERARTRPSSSTPKYWIIGR